jgi:hypothetical protein
MNCTYCEKELDRLQNRGIIRSFCDSTCYGLWQRGKKFQDQGKTERPKRLCKIEGCEARHFGKDYCRRHYRHYITLVYFPPKNPRSPRELINCGFCGILFKPDHTGAKYCCQQHSGLARKQPFIIKKGYRKILLPEHPRADGKGYVFEHIIIAEARLGRSLILPEEIHHKDLDRQNNNPENLQVCKSHSEHMRFHLRPPKAKEK